MSETFFSELGLSEFVGFLDEAREALIPDTIYMDGEKNGVPVEKVLQFIASRKTAMHKLDWEVDIDSPRWQSIIAGLEDMKAKSIQP